MGSSWQSGENDLLMTCWQWRFFASGATVQARWKVQVLKRGGRYEWHFKEEFVNNGRMLSQDHGRIVTAVAARGTLN